MKNKFSSMTIAGNFILDFKIYNNIEPSRHSSLLPTKSSMQTLNAIQDQVDLVRSCINEFTQNSTSNRVPSVLDRYYIKLISQIG